jgi:predicted permease
MALVFDDLRAREREAPRALLRVVLLWIKEALGMTRFALRERLGGVRQFRPRVPAGGPGIANEVRWALRGIRARGWRAALMVMLLAVALAANTVLFSAADALVFMRLPYRDAGRLVEFSGFSPTDPRAAMRWMVPPNVFDSLRQRMDLFGDVQGYITGSYTFLPGIAGPEMIRHTFVTPGLVEMLGWTPKWGRTLTAQDAAETGARMVLVAEELARERFGSPALAVGAQLETSDESIVIAGVMASGFKFPDSPQRIWRPLDLRRLQEGSPDSLVPIARLVDGVGAEGVSAALAARPDLLRDSTLPPGWTIAAVAVRGSSAPEDERSLWLVMLGAALCLLAVACANLASLELAGALQRARIATIQMALGASRSSLMRIAAIEGALLVAAAAAIGIVLAAWSLDTLHTWLPENLIRWSANPVDLDLRSLLFMVAVAAATWTLSSLPVALFTSRRDLMRLLRIEGRSMVLSPGGSRGRKILTTAEVALAVLLLAGGVLYVRSYLALLAADKGFDSAGLASLTLTFPPETVSYRSSIDAVLARLRVRPDVSGLSTTAALDIQNTTTATLQIEGGAPEPHQTRMSLRTVDADFFDVMRIRLKRGRIFAAGEPRDHVVLAEPLAFRLWPDGSDPVGRRFRIGPDAAWLTVIGIVEHVRNTSESPVGSRFDHFTVYAPQSPPVPRVTSTARRPPLPAGTRANVPKPGTLFYSQRLLIRVEPTDRLGDIVQDIRTADNRFLLTFEWIDDTYARAFSDRLIAARIVSVFGGIAFLVALTGVYGVMLFLVAGRTREISIRMALGADRRDVGRLVLGSSLRLVAAGVMLGLAGAWLASRWIESQLFGVTGTYPFTYAGVALLVFATALLATWHPARQAASVDPAITLRAE